MYYQCRTFGKFKVTLKHKKNTSEISSSYSLQLHKRIKNLWKYDSTTFPKKYNLLKIKKTLEK